jgi:hypothetical protein
MSDPTATTTGPADVDQADDHPFAVAARNVETSAQLHAAILAVVDADKRILWPSMEVEYRAVDPSAAARNWAEDIETLRRHAPHEHTGTCTRCACHFEQVPGPVCAEVASIARRRGVEIPA